MLSKIRLFALLVALSAALPVSPSAQAQDTAPVPATAEKAQAVDILPAKSLSGGEPYFNEDDATHPPVKLTPDKSELLRLEQEAGSVIIGNPAHLSVMADSTKTLVLVPKAVGATYLLILNRKGETIMQRHVIVASPKEKYVRIRKACSNTENESCKPTQVYYCPDMCHEIADTGGEKKSDDGSIEDKLKGISKDIDDALDEGEETTEE